LPNPSGDFIKTIGGKMDISMFHNPKCSKSRETLKLLNEEGIEPDIILYLTAPPSQKELSEILKKLKMKPRDLIRFKEPIAEKLKIKPSDNRPDTEWLKLMVENPILIERPIVITSEKAVIGRPPEKVLDLVGE
jgi:arsenate reductase